MKQHLQLASPVPFHDSDALLLLSIALACGSSSASLGGIVHMSDSVSTSPVSFEQLDGGIARLQAAGLINFDGLRVRPSEPTLNVIESLSSQCDSPGSLCALVNELLRQDAVAQGPDDLTWTTSRITRQQFDAL